MKAHWELVQAIALNGQQNISAKHTADMLQAKRTKLSFKLTENVIEADDRRADCINKKNWA